MRSAFACLFRVYIGLLTLTAALKAAPQAAADTYPSRPITLVVGIGAGGAADVTTRLIADKASQILGQRIVVENRTGGGGVPAALAVKQAAPDGYTLLFVLANLHSVALIEKHVPFDPIEDFTMIAALYSAPSFLVVNPKAGSNTVEEYVKYARAKPNGVTYGSPGRASPGDLMGTLFGEAAGLNVVHVPFRGSASIGGELLAERLDFAFTTYPNASSLIEQGQLRALAIASPARWKQTPNIPTLAEAGYGGIEVDNLFGIAGPKGMSPAIVNKLNKAFRKASKDPAIVGRLPGLGAIAHDSPPDELARLIRDDATRLAPFFKKLNLQKQ